MPVAGTNNLQPNQTWKATHKVTFDSMGILDTEMIGPITVDVTYTYRVRVTDGSLASDYSNTASATPRSPSLGHLSVTPPSLAFTGVRPRASATKNVTVKNTGTGPLKVTAGAVHAPFAVRYSPVSAH